MTRLTRTIATIAAAAAVAATALGVSAPAYATGDAAVPRLKVAITARIDLRLAALTRFNAAISVARNLSASDKSTLTTLTGSDRSGLEALRTKVAGETTADALKADATSMIDDYRIFILVGPKVRLTIAGDAEVAANAKLTDVYTKLAGLVAKEKANGTDTTSAEQLLAQMQASLTKAAGDIDGQVATLLAIQPGPDAAGIHAKVLSVRSAMGSGRADLKAAIADAKQVRDFLKANKKN